MIEFDFTKFLKQLEGIQKDLEPTVSETLDTLANIAITNAKSTTLFKDRTGTLRREIKFVKNGALIRDVVADTGYAGYVERGNDPGGGRIYAKHAKALRFVINGQVLFRKWVRAAKPRPFMQAAQTLTESFLPDFAQNRLNNLVDKHSQT
jgi:hypothetical protein